jgi:hypothetical protein
MKDVLAVLLSDVVMTTLALPTLSPEGTVAVIEESVQLVTVVAVPPKLTVPFVVPKSEPLIVTKVPTAPELGLMLLIEAPDAFTVKVELAVRLPDVVTIKLALPVLRPEGTVAEIDESVQLVTVAAAPPMLTVPCVDPK